MSETSEALIRRRLSNDLATALRSRRSSEVAVLRTLLGALDNAGAVPLSSSNSGFSQASFGDGTVEVSRRSLTETDTQAILVSERNEQLEAAALFASLGQTESAERHRGNIAVIERYLEAL